MFTLFRKIFGVLASLGHNLAGIGNGCDFKPDEGDSMGTKSPPSWLQPWSFFPTAQPSTPPETVSTLHWTKEVSPDQKAHLATSPPTNG